MVLNSVCNDEFFAKFARSMPRLEALSLAGFPHVGVLTLSALASSPRMRWLSFRHIDAAVLPALHHSTSLRVLDFHAPADHESIARHVQVLTQLALLSLPGVADSVVESCERQLKQTLVTCGEADLPSDPFLGDMDNCV